MSEGNHYGVPADVLGALQETDKLIAVEGEGVVLSGNRKVSLVPHTRDSFKIVIEDPFTHGHVRGLSPTDIKAGVVNPSAVTYRVGHSVFADMIISREAAEALRDLLNELL